MANDDSSKTNPPPAPPRRSVPPPRASAPPPPPKRQALPVKPPPEEEKPEVEEAPAAVPPSSSPPVVQQAEPAAPAAEGDSLAPGDFAQPEDMVGGFGSAPPEAAPQASASPAPSPSPAAAVPSPSPPAPSAPPPAATPSAAPPTPSAPPRPAAPVAAPPEPEKKNTGLIAGLGIVVVVLILLFVGYLFLGNRAGPASLVGAVVPPNAVVTLDGQQLPVSAGRYNLGQIEAGEHFLEFSAPGHVPQSLSITVEPGEAEVVPPVMLASAAAALPVKTGLAVRVLPAGATIFVDDQPRPEKTPAEFVPVPAGPHNVRLEMEGFQPLTKAVALVEGAVLPIDGQLQPAGASLNVTIAALEPAGATCTLSQEGRQPRPVTSSFSVTADGNPTLRCTADGHDQMEQRIEATAGEPAVNVEMRLRPMVAAADTAPTGGSKGTKVSRPSGSGKAPAKRGGTKSKASPAPAGGDAFLSVATRPWTKVYMDGRLIGNTPVIRHKVTPGRHRLILINEDFNIRESTTVRVKAGQTKQVVRNMVQ